MKRLLLVSLASVALGGCISQHNVAISGRDWHMGIPVLSAGGDCRIAGAQLINQGPTTRNAGLWIATVANQSKSMTLGDIWINCPTTFPGGTGQCTSVPFLFRCQPIYIEVREPLFR